MRKIQTSSTPGFGEFTPEKIAWQDAATDAVLTADYSLGVHEFLFSGSVGSAKTALMAHLGVRHCMQYPGAVCHLGRRVLKDLRETLYLEITEHLRNDPQLIEGVHFQCFDQPCTVRYCNGSRMIARSWHDKNYKKFRSLKLSMALFEELTENDEEDRQAYMEIKMRVGRLPHVPQNLIIAATNPDEPDHWAYEYFRLDLDEDPELRGAA